MRDERSNEPRRQKVKGRTGIYFRIDVRGERLYEHDYYGSDGRRRWKSGFATMKQALASREDINVRVRRGERVVPTSVRFDEYAQRWLTSVGHLRSRTIERYEINVRLHLSPRLGRLRLADVTEDHFVLIRDEMKDAGYAGWTTRGVQRTLGQILAHATRRGIIATNPALRLERGDRAAVGRRDQRVLSREEIGQLLDAAPDQFRMFLTTAVFSGLRLGELLGMRWVEVDFDAGFLRVRKQLDRDGTRTDPKTPQAKRDVVLMPTLGTALKEHRIASPFSSPTDFVFASRRGTALNYRNAQRRGLEAAAHAAGLNGQDRPRLRLHDLRHTFASLLIANGVDVVSVSAQLGHATPDITLKVYAHLFDAARNADRTRSLLEASFGEVVEATRPLGR